MRILDLLIFVALLGASGIVSAEVCEDEINHLKDFGVSYIQKPTTPNSNFIYRDIGGLNMVLAIPRDDVARWKISASSTAEGYAFSARGMIVGISGEFDKNGRCLNSATFEYDIMTKELPKTVENKSLTFNYNFQVCQKVEHIMISNKMRVNLENADTLTDELKKNHLTDYNGLLQLSKIATENKFYKLVHPSVSHLITKCMLAIGNRKAASLPKPATVPKSAAP